MRHTIVVAVLALGLGIAACGGDSGPTVEERKAEAAAEARAKERKEGRAKQEKAQKCVAAYSDLKEAVDNLDSRLGVGLSFDDYSTAVGDIRVAYDQTENSDDAECLSNVGVALENALNQYVKAFNVWNDCFEDIDCDNDSIQPELQKHWTKASLQIRGAELTFEDAGESP